MMSRIAGLLATLRLLLSGLDVALTTLLGLPPVAWVARQLATAIRDTYRLGRFGPPSTCTDLAVIVHDGDIIEERHRG